jgi:hypothetical protein
MDNEKGTPDQLSIELSLSEPDAYVIRLFDLGIP